MLNLAKRVAEEVDRIGAGVSLLEVSVEAGDLGPVIVLAGDADSSSVTQLNEVLIAQVSGRTRHLTIDATNLRSIDPATAQTLMLAAPIVMVRGGSTVLVNPQEPVLKMLNHTRTTEMFTIQSRTPARPANERRRPVPMTDHEQEPDWPVTLRRQPGSLNTGHAEGDTSMFEIICRGCGNDPTLDHREVSAELQQLRGRYTLSTGMAAFTRHNEVHNGTGEIQPGRN
jgi:anti-anti-sigma factor